MKKLAFVVAALTLGAGVAIAKEANAPKAMNDSEMEKVFAGDNTNANWLSSSTTPGNSGTNNPNGGGHAYGALGGNGK